MVKREKCLVFLAFLNHSTKRLLMAEVPLSFSSPCLASSSHSLSAESPSPSKIAHLSEDAVKQALERLRQFSASLLEHKKVNRSKLAQILVLFAQIFLTMSKPLQPRSLRAF